MVIANLSRDEKGQIIGTTDRVKKSMFGSKDRYWRSMLDDGKITTVNIIINYINVAKFIIY